MTTITISHECDLLNPMWDCTTIMIHEHTIYYVRLILTYKRTADLFWYAHTP